MDIDFRSRLVTFSKDDLSIPSVSHAAAVSFYNLMLFPDNQDEYKAAELAIKGDALLMHYSDEEIVEIFRNEPELAKDLFLYGKHANKVLDNKTSSRQSGYTAVAGTRGALAGQVLYYYLRPNCGVLGKAHQECRDNIFSDSEGKVDIKTTSFPEIWSQYKYVSHYWAAAYVNFDNHLKLLQQGHLSPNRTPNPKAPQYLSQLLETALSYRRELTEKHPLAQKPLIKDDDLYLVWNTIL
jgi:hypothetical protein